MAQYLVGFDRFIALEWANYALELASRPDSSPAKISHLKDWLSLRISGEVSVRKTANVLARLWLEPNVDVDRFREQARQLAIHARRSDWVVFHWGMALLVFPFFREICFQTGRLLALQESTSRREIHVRLSEKYSNLGTVPRSIDRVLQSLVDWGLLEKASSENLRVKHHKTSDLSVKRWLLEIAVFSTSQMRIPFSSFYKSPELFAFEFNGDIAQIVTNSEKIGIERDGGNVEYLVWRE